MSIIDRLLDFVQYLWPFRKVEPWETGVLIVFGKAKRVLPPGIYLVLPYFVEVHNVSSASARIICPKQDVTLRDGTLLTFSASAQVRVLDAALASIAVDNFSETARELLASVVADKIGELDPERLTAGEKRGRLLADLRRWYGVEIAQFGMECSQLTFTNYLVGVKTIRLITSQGDLAGVW